MYSICVLHDDTGKSFEDIKKYIVRIKRMKENKM